MALSVADARRLVDRVYADSESVAREIATGLTLSDDGVAAIETLYVAEVAAADHVVGELVAAARAASGRDLVVVVAGDHGELFGECGLLGHNLVLHDAVVRVPMVVAGVEGVVDDDETMSQHVDLTRTVADVCGVDSEQFEGRDLRDGDRPYAISQRGRAYLSEYLTHDPTFDADRFGEAPFTAVRTPRWKYLAGDERDELYELPDEETPRGDDHPDVVRELAGVVDDEGLDCVATGPATGRRSTSRPASGSARWGT